MTAAILRRQIEEIVLLEDDEFEFVLSHFLQRTFKKHQIVIYGGDQVPFEYFVTKGLMKVSRIDDNGKEHIVQFAMENWWITDTNAFHNQDKATLTLDCLEDAVVFALSLENKEKLCREMSKMQYFFLKKTIAGYIALQRRILCLISSNAHERYNNFLALYPGLMQRVPRTMIASYLGMTRETLSRLNAAV